MLHAPRFIRSARCTGEDSRSGRSPGCGDQSVQVRRPGGGGDRAGAADAAADASSQSRDGPSAGDGRRPGGGRPLGAAQAAAHGAKGSPGTGAALRCPRLGGHGAPQADSFQEPNNLPRQRLLAHAKTVKHPAQPCPSAGRRSSVRSVLKAFPACPNRFVRVAVHPRQRRGGVCLQREHCLPCSRASRGSHRPLPGRLPRRPARCISPVRRDPALSETIGLPAPRRAPQAAEPSSRSTGLAGRLPSAAYRRSGETRPSPPRSRRIRDLRLAPR